VIVPEIRRYDAGASNTLTLEQLVTKATKQAHQDNLESILGIIEEQSFVTIRPLSTTLQVKTFSQVIGEVGKRNDA
jgi:methyltransferase-like protein